MKTLTLLFLLALPQTALTNKDVIETVGMGLGPEVVAAKIRNSKTNFDTSLNALQQLKREGVPDAVLLAMVESGSGTAANPDEGVLVPEGTAFTAQVLDDVLSETASEGDPVTLKATESVKVNGRLVIKSGTIVKGVVAEVQSSGKGGRAGLIRITLKTVNAVDGQKIKVSASRSSAGQDRTHKAMKTTAERNPFSGMVRGGKAKIRAGTEMTVYTDEDKTVKSIDN